MEQKMKNWDAVGSIRIGTSITIGTHILPALTRNFQREYPELRWKPSSASPPISNSISG